MINKMISKKAIDVKRRDKQLSEIKNKQLINQKRMGNSNIRYFCSIEGCEFYCVRSDGMMNHEISVHNNDNNNQINQFAKFSKDTDIDYIKKQVAENIGNISNSIRQISTQSRRIAAGRVEGPTFKAEDIHNDYVFDGETSLDRKNEKRIVGFGHKSTSTQVRCTESMYQFILFVQGRGDKNVGNGNKTLPSDAAKAMKYFGTDEGAKVFLSTPHDREFMSPNPDNIRFYKLHHLLNQQQLKGFMSLKRSALEKSCQRLQIKALNEIEIRSNPLLKAIQDLKSSKQIIKIIGKIYQNHNVPEDEQDRYGINQLSTKLSRDFLYNLVTEKYRSEPNDIAIYKINPLPLAEQEHYHQEYAQEEDMILAEEEDSGDNYIDDE